MPLAGFEPPIPVFKRAKTFHALDRAATLTGNYTTYDTYFGMWKDMEGVVIFEVAGCSYYCFH
jgi:hypothetical protein